MNTLFCTADQGARLKELVPELEYQMEWGRSHSFSNWGSEPKSKGYHLQYMMQSAPALTLQELRDVAQREFAGEIVADPVFANAFETWVYTSSAPDFAEWLIARLEDKP